VWFTFPYRGQHMVRQFDFNKDAKDSAYFRQWNKCAHCGVSLVDYVDHAHHVVPNQSGNLANSKHACLTEIDNCVMLCETCHIRVHQDGRFRTGATALPDYFLYSHGPDRATHEKRVKQLNTLPGQFFLAPCNPSRFREDQHQLPQPYDLDHHSPGRA